jgi:2,3-bisphosphoglycerate-independent phosphoglycerate mutase
MLILPDHYTRIDTRKHDPTPVPFLIAGSGVRSVLGRRFTEAKANASDLHVPYGHELMEYFLQSGRA